MNASLHANMTALQSLHRFGDLYERALLSVNSDLVTLEPLRSTEDSIGRHWYGMRLRVVSRKSGQQFYLHTGLIYLPETRVGLMVEVDRKNNLNTYNILWDELEDGELFTVNRQEDEYLKLFMPDDAFLTLGGLSAAEQIRRLAAYAKEACEAIAETEDRRGFMLDYADLADAYALAVAFEQALTACGSPRYRIRLNKADPDNFGQYASGYRYWLESPDGSISMYAYFGAIYSYKKRPCGVFAEIDKPSNPDVFDGVAEHFEDNEAYDYSRREPNFIKLFMPADAVARFNTAEPSEQRNQLAEFVNTCNACLMEAAEQGRKNK